MEKFCEDIAVEPENVVMLVLAYKMNARQMGFFSLNEWLHGLSELQCDSINKVQQKLEYLRNLLNDPHTFKGIYRYAYDFARVSRAFFFINHELKAQYFWSFCYNLTIFFFFRTKIKH